jgi:uncharacterized repeat protein (TIGR03803 family)
VYGQTIGNTFGAWYAADEGRLLDEQFELDELESLNASDPRLGGRLDLDNIGVFGWSLGGAIAAQLCLRDPRCKAGVGMEGAPYLETNLLTQPLSVPYLYFRCDDGRDLDPLGNVYGRPDDRLAVYNEQVTNAYWVKLVSTVHQNFGDPGLILDSASLEKLIGTPMSGQFLAPARVSQIVRAYLLSFFNKFLKGEDDHLLDGPSPAYPEIIQFLSKSSSSVRPEYPSAALVQGSDGNFYGTTAYGGASGKGAVFQVTPGSVLTTLVSFNGTNGGYPFAGLVEGRDGNFYGTTAGGGANSGGTVFNITPAGLLTTLVSFGGANGSYPYAGLVQGSDGNFYGTTAGGGANSGGTVFKMTPTGALTTLVVLSLANGGYPWAGLVQGSDGNFYGTTEYGGNLSLNGGSGFGTVFRMTPAGALTTLASLNGFNGSYCVGGLVQGSDGNFYGTTAGGGAGGCGTVFKMTPAGLLTTLVSFNGADGNSPQAALVPGNDGNFYGTTEYGGASRKGTVFQVAPTGMLTTLVSF